LFSKIYNYEIFIFLINTNAFSALVILLKIQTTGQNSKINWYKITDAGVLVADLLPLSYGVNPGSGKEIWKKMILKY
jgi:hypothetical protein